MAQRFGFPSYPVLASRHELLDAAGALAQQSASLQSGVDNFLAAVRAS
ncbi:hypothetical protein [Rhodospirillaceae bacterium SYSU D60014]